MLWAGRDQSGGCHLVGYDDSIVPLSPIPLPSIARTQPPNYAFFTVAGDAIDFDACLRFCFFESLLTCLHLQEFVSGGFVQNDGWLTLVCGAVGCKAGVGAGEASRAHLPPPARDLNASPPATT